MARLGTPQLFRRQVLADRAAVLTVTIVVLVVAALLAAWPRAIDHMFTEEFGEQVTAGYPTGRDLSAHVRVQPPFQPDLEEGRSVDIEVVQQEIYGGFEEALHDIRHEAPELLLSALGDPEYVLVGDHFPLPEHVPDHYRRGVEFAPVADPYLADRVQMVDGELPGPVEILDDPEREAQARAALEAAVSEDRFIGNFDLDEWDLRPRAMDVALSEITAERLEWPVGQIRKMEPPEGIGFVGWPTYARLSGIFEQTDPDVGYWAHAVGLLQPVEEHDPNAGTKAWTRGFVHPAAAATGMLSWVQVATVWYPADGSQLAAADAPAVLDELRAFTAVSHRVSMDEGTELGGSSDTLRLSTLTTDTIVETLSRQASATALMGLVGAGPFGVALAVLALGSKLVVERRRRAMALVTARGASRRQLRGLLTAEGLLLGLPAAALAVAAARWLVPGDGGVVGWVLPLLVGLAPALFLPFVARPGAVRTERADLGGRRSNRLRWAAELLVVAAAVAAVVALNRRGLTTGEPGAGPDMLLVAAPLLAAVAVCVLVLRFYPIPVAALSRLLKRRTGVVGFVGAIRVVRDPAAGLAPVLALVVGLSVAVFSTVLWSTTQGGGASESINRVGADLRAGGMTMAPEQAEAVLEVPGVGAAVTLADQGRVNVIAGNLEVSADLFLADTDALAEVQSGLSGVELIAENMSEPQDGALPVMMSSEIASVGDDVFLDHFGGTDVTVVGAPAEVAGLATSRPWVLLNTEALATLGPRGTRAPRALLIGSDGAPIDRDEVAQVLGPDVELTTAVDVVGEVRAGAVGTGLMVSFATAAGVVGALSAVAVLLTMVIGAPARGRLFSQLRTLGLSGRQAQGLAAWEMAPLALVALAFGTGLGVGIPWVVFSAIDLRPLTGAVGQPPVIVDWSLVGAAAGVFVGIVAVAVVVAVVTSRRLRLGTVLRVGEEL